LRGMCGPGPVEAHVSKRLMHLRNATAYVYERHHQDGRVLEMRGNPIPGGGFVTSFSDITEYRRTEQALREVNETLEYRVQQRTAELSTAKAEAERANSAKSRFLAAISHDVFQPLNAAQLFTHTLSHQLAGHKGPLETVENVYSSLRSVESLLGGLLDMSKLEAGGLQPVREPFALAELLDSLTLEYGAMAREKNLTLTCVNTRLWVNSDRQLLRRIVQNFLANAVRYTEHGRILLGCRRRGDKVCIQVVDTGPGIRPQEHQRIFEEFQQLGRGNRATEGLGLGLAIAKGIAGLLDYPLEVRSSPGAGAMFGIEVPLTKAVVGQVPVPAAANREIHLRVLCIEDDPAVLKAQTGL
ncbi:MAG TPA: PAS domain-containing sensor histidine kinase, partial [Chromatiales bacterium]|nr:PAS domain-containing sensor histidine kinase [Chromatiales bacterium]